MYRAGHATSSEPSGDFIVSSKPDFWTKSNEPEWVGDFSAICLLFAKNLAKNLDGKVGRKMME